MRLVSAVAALAAAAAASACGGSRPMVSASEPLGVSRVVLFQNGLAYIERRGAVEAGAVEVTTRTEQLDDVLKSLAVVDRTGGGVSSVRVLPAGAEARDVTLRVGLAGDGAHDLTVSYVAAVSGWRPTYRLVDEGEGRVRVQGLAVVDNQTGEPWRGISLVLSTDVPLSFRYALREPRLVERPELSSDGRLLQKVLPAVSPSLAEPSDVNEAYGLANAYQPELSTRAGARVELEPGEPGAAADPAPLAVDPARALDEHVGTTGVFVESPTRFSLEDGETGLVPFLDQVTEGERVLLFKPAPGGSASHHRPYQAVLFRNPLDAPLLTGPVAVYAEGSFLGDGVTGTIPAGTHAFVAYSLDPGVGVESRAERASDDVRAVALTGGVLTVELQAVARTTFEVTSPTPLGLPLYLFAEAVEGFEPRSLPDGAITTPAGYFVPAPRGARHARVDFEQVRERTERVNVAADPSHPYVTALLGLLEGRSDGDEAVGRLRGIVDRLAELDRARDRCEEDLEVQRAALAERREALEALRDVPANAALRRRIAGSVAEGVRRVDDLTRDLVEANAEGVALREQWYDLLRDLTV